MPTVSVIIPAYRVTAYVAEAIDSVIRQTYQDFEIILVNDGCPDTANLERVLTPYLSRLRYVRQENSGPAMARNTGIHASTGELIAFLDADDIWEPEYLVSQIGYLDQNPAVDVVYPDAVYFGDGPLVGRRFMEYCPSMGEVTVASLIAERCCVFISVLARRKALMRTGLFDPAMKVAEDFDLWLRVVRAGGRIGYQKKPLVRYRKRGTSLSVDVQNMITGRLLVLKKIEADSRLSAEERTVIEEARGRWLAQSKLETGKKLLIQRDYPAALADLSAASRYFSSPKLRAALFLLRFSPPLARWAFTQFGMGG